MPAFSLTPLPPFPYPRENFPSGIQFEVNGLAVGLAQPAIVNIVGDVYPAYDPATGVLILQFGPAPPSGT